MATTLLFYVVLIARLSLVGVFVTASIGKLTDQPAFRRVVREFNISGRAVKPVAWFLPIVELLVASLLCNSVTARWGGLSAALLLTLFSAVILGSLVRGKHPVCHCFGDWTDRPVGVRSVLRNIILTVLAGLAALPQPTPSTLPLVIAALSAIVFWPGLGLRGRIREIQTVPTDGVVRRGGNVPTEVGLTVGDPAPDVPVVTADGVLTTLARYYHAAPTVLLMFLEPDCRLCLELFADLRRWASMTPPGALVVVNRAMIPALTSDQALSQVEVVQQRSGEPLRAFRIWSTPAAVLVKGGIISSTTATGPDEVRKLASCLPLELDPTPEALITTGEERSTSSENDELDFQRQARTETEAVVSAIGAEELWRKLRESIRDANVNEALLVLPGPYQNSAYGFRRKGAGQTQNGTLELALIVSRAGEEAFAVDVNTIRELAALLRVSGVPAAVTLDRDARPYGVTVYGRTNVDRARMERRTLSQNA